MPGRVALAVSARSGSVAAEPRFARIESDGSFELPTCHPATTCCRRSASAWPGVAPEFGVRVHHRGRTRFAAADHQDGGRRDARRPFHQPRADRRFPCVRRSLHAAPIDVDRSPPDGRGPEGLAVHDDGRFYLTGLFGPMRLTYPAPAGWYLKSITIGGIDVTDQSFDFGFGDQIRFRTRRSCSRTRAHALPARCRTPPTNA